VDGGDSAQLAALCGATAERLGSFCFMLVAASVKVMAECVPAGCRPHSPAAENAPQHGGLPDPGPATTHASCPSRAMSIAAAAR
jgi:hypothetical protein